MSRPDDKSGQDRQESQDSQGAELTPANVAATPSHREQTDIIHAGMDPFAHYGFINPPSYRGSTVLFPTVEALQTRTQPYLYGRRGTPTIRALEAAIAKLEGAARCFATSSGLAAINLTMFALLKQGDHILIIDNAYQPTRAFADGVLTKFGIEVSYFDPLIGSGIAALLKPNTTVILCEAPGSQTFEMPDIGAISAIAQAHNIWHVLDNTWASPLFFKPFNHGVDVSIQAATKYIVGHSDAMLGAVSVNQRAAPLLIDAVDLIGFNPGSEETYLGLRGIKTIDVRLRRHWQSGVEIANWLEQRPEIERVLHPALPSHPGHEIWKRDFLGASGLFTVILKPCSKAAVAAMLDHLELFGMGYSWGGFESLVIPFDPRAYRTATTWQAEGQALRFHIGLEDVEDLKTDLKEGFCRLASTP